MNRLIFLVFLSWLASIGFPQNAQAKRSKGLTVEEQYELGQRYLKRGYYIKAVEQFNRIRNNYRDDALAIEAELAIADVHFKKGDWDIARTSYDAFRRRYPRHERIDYVVYQIGLTFYKKAPRFAGRDQTWTSQAISSWARFEDKYTTSEYGVEVLELREECLERLAKKEIRITEFYVRREAWVAVQRRAKGLVQEYPDSQYKAEALYWLSLSSTYTNEIETVTAALVQLDALDPERSAVARRKIDRIKQAQMELSND